jgi:hypothetical protein
MSLFAGITSKAAQSSPMRKYTNTTEYSFSAPERVVVEEDRYPFHTLIPPFIAPLCGPFGRRNSFFSSLNRNYRFLTMYLCSEEYEWLKHISTWGQDAARVRLHAKVPVFLRLAEPLFWFSSSRTGNLSGTEFLRSFVVLYGTSLPRSPTCISGLHFLVSFGFLGRRLRSLRTFQRKILPCIRYEETT